MFCTFIFILFFLDIVKDSQKGYFSMILSASSLFLKSKDTLLNSYIE